MSSSSSSSSLSSSSSSPSRLSSLFSPVKMGPLQLRNRIIVGPVTRNRGPTFNHINAEYYAQRARDTGLIISEGVLIEPQGAEWSFAPGIWSSEQVQGWKLVTDAVHKQGGLIVAQLWHLGRLNHPQLQAGQPNYGPSPVTAKGGKFRQLDGVPGYVEPREMSIADIERNLRVLRTAAELAKEAGFDGVEMQGAGGYLYHQFLDPLANQRTDEYGGSVENRCRFVLRAVDELIDVWGSGRVGIRLMPAGGFNDMGFEKKATIATYAYLLQQLSKREISFVEMERYMPFLDLLDRGTKDFDTVVELKQYYQVKDGIWIGNGGYDAKEGDESIRTGLVDAISYSRPFIANPDLVTRFKYDLPIAEVKWENIYGQLGGTRDQGYTDYPLAQIPSSSPTHSSSSGSAAAHTIAINATTTSSSSSSSSSSSAAAAAAAASTATTTLSTTSTATNNTTSTSTSTSTSTNKSLVLKAFDTLFNRRDFAEAAKLWSPDYIQHSAHIEAGREGLFNLVRSLPDTLRYESGLIVAEGDYVMVHSRYSGNGQPHALITIDIVRVENGRLAEHWDVWQPEVTAAESKSGAPMFGLTFQLATPSASA